MILVRLMIRNLDSASREAWEIQLGSSTEYPTLEQLRKFLTGRARALESLEIEKSRTSLKPTSKCPTRSYASTVESEAPSRPPPSSEDRTTKSQACDDCGGDHYIAFCPRFKERSPASRDQVVTDKWLCFNCLGRHNLRTCRNKTTCRHCQGRNHSLLHHHDTPSSSQRASTSTPRASTPAVSATTRQPEPTPSTSSKYSREPKASFTGSISHRPVKSSDFNASSDCAESQ